MSLSLSLISPGSICISICIPKKVPKKKVIQPKTRFNRVRSYERGHVDQLLRFIFLCFFFLSLSPWQTVQIRHFNRLLSSWVCLAYYWLLYFATTSPTTLFFVLLPRFVKEKTTISDYSIPHQAGDPLFRLCSFFSGESLNWSSPIAFIFFLRFLYYFSLTQKKRDFPLSELFSLTLICLFPNAVGRFSILTSSTDLLVSSCYLIKKR